MNEFAPIFITASNRQEKSYPNDSVNHTMASFTVLSFTGYMKHLIRVNQIWGENN